MLSGSMDRSPVSGAYGPGSLQFGGQPEMKPPISNTQAYTPSASAPSFACHTRGMRDRNPTAAVPRTKAIPTKRNSDERFADSQPRPVSRNARLTGYAATL